MNTLKAEREATVETLVKLNRTCGCSLGWCTECLKWKGVFEIALLSHEEKVVNRTALDALKFMNEEYKDGITGEELTKTMVRYLTNVAMNNDKSLTLPITDESV